MTKPKNRKASADLGRDTHDKLAPFFAAEKDAPPRAPAALMARIVHDATRPAPAMAARRWSWRLDFWQALGGWRAAATLAACLLVGVTLGYTPSDGLGRLADMVLSTALSTTGLGEGADLNAGAQHFTLDDLQAEG